MKLSRTQIEIIIIGALLLILVLYNLDIPIDSPIEVSINSEITSSSVNGTNASEKNGNNAENRTNSNQNISTEVYTGKGVTFKYPDSWTVTSEKSEDDDMIFVSKGDQDTYLQIQIIENPEISQKEFEEEGDNSIMFGAKKISNTTIYIDGQRAYLQDHISYFWPFSWNYQIRTITFIKNNKMYAILLQAPREEFNKEPFNVIIDSLKIQ